MENIIPLTNSPISRPLVGISGCLSGQKVRYDGQSKLSNFYDALSTHLSWLNFCPEVDAGLGVPRPPVQLVKTKKNTKALGVNDKSLDVTDQLRRASRNFWEQNSDLYPASAKHSQNFMCGYIFKSRSPSCGLGSTPLYDESGNTNGLLTSGLFAQQALDHPHSLILAEETLLVSPENQAIFISACYVNQALHSDTKLNSQLFNVLMNTTETEKSTFRETELLEHLLAVLSNSYSAIEGTGLIKTINKKTALDRRFLCGELTSFWNL